MHVVVLELSGGFCFDEDQDRAMTNLIHDIMLTLLNGLLFLVVCACAKL